MNKHQPCYIGRIILDKVVTPQNTVYIPGGTAFYCSHVICHFDDINYALATAVGTTEMNAVEQLREMSIHVTTLPSKYSIYSENTYDANPDDRTQRVLAKADPSTAGQLKDMDAQIYRLGPLPAGNFSLEAIRELSQRGLITVSSQSYLCGARDTHVYPVDWVDKRGVLQYIHFLKVNEHEMEALVGPSGSHEVTRQLYEWGVKGVLVTLGSIGSPISNGKDSYRTPIYKPKEMVDTTECGDTYTIGHLYQRVSDAGIEEAGRFAAAMSTLKIERSGPFNGSKEDVIQCMTAVERVF